MSADPTKPDIVVIDDEPQIRRLLRFTLEEAGYAVREAEAGQAGLHELARRSPEAVILDLGLPDMPGLEVLKLLRAWSTVPVLILSVFGEENGKIAALDAGADDYLTKPFGVGELQARIRSALRRANKAANTAVLEAGDLNIDLSKRLVQVSHQPVQLTPTEYDLLKALVRYPDRVLTHRHLIREVWGGTCYEDEMHLLRVNISNLRRKLESDPTRPRYIVTEAGVGYRLRMDSDETP
jgi:two-component system, OmpR family, KDP operon response regulator KdpE